MYNYPEATYVRDGEGPPNDLEGVNSEYYIDTTNYDLYLKLAGTYTKIGSVVADIAADVATLEAQVTALEAFAALFPGMSAAVRGSATLDPTPINIFTMATAHAYILIGWFFSGTGSNRYSIAFGSRRADGNSFIQTISASGMTWTNSSGIAQLSVGSGTTGAQYVVIDLGWGT